MALRVGGACVAGGSKEYETGVWRTLTPIVDKEKCIGCKICEDYCPDGCIEVKDDVCTIDYFYCKGCGICTVECPKKAIQMEG